MEEASGGGIMEEAFEGGIKEGGINMEEACGRGIMDEESWSEASWMRNHGGDIMEEASGGGAGLAWLAWLAWLAQFTYVKH